MDPVVVRPVHHPALQLVVAADERQRWQRGVNLRRRRDQVVHEPVVRSIDGELLAQPEMKGLRTGPGLARGPQQIAEEPGPLFRELVTREQRVDEAAAFIGGRVGEKRARIAAFCASGTRNGWPAVAFAEITFPSSSIRICTITVPCVRVFLAIIG